MSGGVLIAVTIIATVVGYLLNLSYQNKYNEPAIVWVPFGMQALFVALMLLTWPNYEPSCWFIAWTILAIISYVIGFITCKAHAKLQSANSTDMWLAVAAQLILPLGVALVIVIIFAIVFMSMGGGKKKSR